MKDKEFIEAAEALLAKYQDTPLPHRWKEAISFGARANAVAYWIRDSEDVVNIVWLTPSSIRDIVWFPKQRVAVFNFLPLQNIKAVEVREATDVTTSLGFPVKGDLVIRLFCTSKPGTLVWAANTKQQTEELLAFALQAFSAYAVIIGE